MPSKLFIVRPDHTYNIEISCGGLHFNKTEPTLVVEGKVQEALATGFLVEFSKEKEAGIDPSDNVLISGNDIDSVEESIVEEDKEETPDLSEEHEESEEESEESDQETKEVEKVLKPRTRRNTR